MDYPVVEFLIKTARAFSTDALFLCAVIFILFLFAVFFIRAAKGKTPSGVIACVYFSVTALSSVVLTGAVCVLVQTSFYVFTFYLSVLISETAVLLLPFQAVSVDKTDRAAEKELIKYIDGEIKKESDETRPENFREKIKCEEIKTPPQTDGLDFSHVKSVIERLEYFDLTPADKKQIETLKSELYVAEREGFTPEKKSRINDGLAGLLKIMSKYGV